MLIDLHFSKGPLGKRSFKRITVEAVDRDDAERQAKSQTVELRSQGFNHISTRLAAWRTN